MFLEIIGLGIVGYCAWRFIITDVLKERMIMKNCQNASHSIFHLSECTDEDTTLSYILLVEDCLDFQHAVILKDFTMEELKRFIENDNPKYFLSKSTFSAYTAIFNINLAKNLCSKDVQNRNDLTDIEKGKIYIIFKRDVFKGVADLFDELIKSYGKKINHDMDRILRRNKFNSESECYDNFTMKLIIMKTIMMDHVIKVLKENIKEFCESAMKNDSLKRFHSNYKNLQRMLMRNHFETSFDNFTTYEMNRIGESPFKWRILKNEKENVADEYFHSYFKDIILKHPQINLLNRIKVSCGKVKKGFFPTSIVDMILNNVYVETY